MKKAWPNLKSDAEAEAFIDEADLSEYDFSQMVPIESLELRKKDARLELRLSQHQLDALKSAAKEQGIPYTRLARLIIERGLQAFRP